MMETDTENETGVRRLEAGMPTLVNLERSLRSKRDLGKLIGVHRLPSGNGKQIADGFVRHVEKALLEYNDSRDSLLRFLEMGEADDEYRASDHFESCVQSLHKAINYIERLRTMGYGRDDGTPLVPRPRDMTVLLETSKSGVRRFRDAIEHLDNDIIGGRISEKQRIGVHLGWQRASIADSTLEYRDVAKWIEQLHSIAGLLSRMRIVTSTVPQEEPEP
ncbi:MAG: hypothetical protein O2931_08895 [Planctomycetota bacterium]|nr:hypothetical protein [Planctomycetota bacterium]MDA1178899.1 hypothetical protein [Planctomycetota bacterium]